MRCLVPLSLLALGSACTAADPEPSQPPEQPEQPSVEDANEPDGEGVAGVAARTIAEVQAKQAQPEVEPEPPEPSCKADVGDPALLFGETILMRPPKGVEFLPDDNPTFAHAVMSGGFISACDANVKRVQVFAFANDATMTMEDYIRDFQATLATSGYTGGSSTPVVEGKDERHVAYEFPAAGGQPPSSLYVAALRRKGATVPPAGKIDNVFIVVYETSPEDYPTLEPTFKQSGSSLLIVPP